MKRALLVEDEGVVALLIESMLGELGYQVLGPVPRLSKAVKVAQDEAFDIAILDVNLNGLSSFPIANVLADKNIPYLFATGYGRRGIPAELSDTVVLQKPFRTKQLAKAIDDAIAANENDTRI